MDKTTKILAVVAFAFVLVTASGVAYLKFTSKSTTTTVFNTNKKYTAVMETSMGTIKLELNPKAAPKTVENFVTLARRQYYDGSTFHRISRDFVIQAGDPTGTGGDSIFGAPFADEIDANSDLYKAGYVKGTLAMANSGANTNGSQFFVVIKDAPTLPSQYTIFGKVTEGQDVADLIGKVDLGKDESGNAIEDGKPVQPVTIKTITITESD
jgi:cyclophilin family peptidyl-prolyl cis-trans isomerase